MSHKEDINKNNTNDEQKENIRFEDLIKKYKGNEKQIKESVNYMIERIEKQEQDFFEVYNEFCDAIKSKNLTKKEFDIKCIELRKAELSSENAILELRQIIKSDLQHLDLNEEKIKLKQLLTYLKKADSILTSSYKDASAKLNKFSIKNIKKRHVAIPVGIVLASVCLFSLCKREINEPKNSLITEINRNDTEEISINDTEEIKCEESFYPFISDEEIQETFETFNMEEIKALINRIKDINYFGYNPAESKVIDYLDGEMICKIIDASDLDNELKNIAKSIMNDSLSQDKNQYKKEDILHLLVAESEAEQAKYFIKLIDTSYNGLRYNQSTYPLSNISVFDNREGLIDLSNQIFLLEDLSIYGDYYIYSSNIYDTYVPQQYSWVGTNYIVADNTGKIRAFFSDFGENYDDYNYTVIQNRECVLIPLANWLYDNNLAEEIKDSYNIDELREELPFSISRKLGGKIEEQKAFDEILTLTIPESTGSWYTSEAGNGEGLYIMGKVCPYLFSENTNIYMDLLHENALITLDLTGFTGFQYKDYENEVYIYLHDDKESYHNLKSINFLKEYTKEELVEMYGFHNEDISKTRTK